eukprot:11032277-Alexandrium_andersonii.AAC.1
MCAVEAIATCIHVVRGGMPQRYVAGGEVGVANHKIAPTAIWLWGPDVPARVSAHPGLARPLASSQGQGQQGN